MESGVYFVICYGSVFAEESHAVCQALVVFANLNAFINVKQINICQILTAFGSDNILNIADRIIVIAGGEVEQSGTREEVLPRLLGSSTACRVLTDKL